MIASVKGTKLKAQSIQCGCLHDYAKYMQIIRMHKILVGRDANVNI